jgi:hypothetical protein
MTRRETINKYVPYPLSDMIIRNVDMYVRQRIYDPHYIDEEVDGDWCCDSYGEVKVHRIIMSVLWIYDTIETNNFWVDAHTYFLNKNI